MRSIRCDGEEEGPLVRHGILQKAIGLAGQNIRRVFAFVADGGVMVSLETGIQIFICVRVKKEVGASESLDEWRVVGTQAVGIEQFAGIVRAVPDLLEPYRKPCLVEALADKLRITA